MYIQNVKGTIGTIRERGRQPEHIRRARGTAGETCKEPVHDWIKYKEKLLKSDL
jgi:hypothetical protein